MRDDLEYGISIEINGAKVNGRVHILRFADDIDLIGAQHNIAQKLLDRVE